MKSQTLQSNTARHTMMATAALIAALSFSSMSQAADAPPAEGAHHGERHHGKGRSEHRPMSPEQVEKRIEHRINRMLSDATPEQKAKVIAIAKAAAQDLRPLHEQRRAAHIESRKLLAQPTIDRAALERARVQEQQVAEQISKRMSQAWADGAEVLTPEQRVKVAERMQKHMGRHMGMHHAQHQMPR